MWIRMIDIAEHATLTAKQKTHLVAQATEELALMMSLQIIHGQERGCERYIEAGGHVRADDDGEPVIWFEEDKENA